MISVILSTNNEIRNNYLERIFESLQNQSMEMEIIVVDNNSSDQTRDICRKYTDKIYILENSNRAERFNYGLERASGDIVLFHHAVTIIPKNSLNDIEVNLRKGADWGGYRHSFDTHHWLLKFTSWYSNNIRAKYKGILYADHIIFGKKEVFESIRGFPNMDVFEETPFCKKLIKQFGMPVLINKIVVTSARRFTERGIYKHAFLNQYLKMCYFLGISHKKMNKSYEGQRGYNVKY